MIYLSIDIETTGLDPEKDQMLEFACVVEDTTRNQLVQTLPVFNCVILHDRITGHPMALAMNADLIRRIADRRGQVAYAGAHGEAMFLRPNDVVRYFIRWLESLKLYPRAGKKLTMAGKNPHFDRSFCRRLLLWEDEIFGHRMADPGQLFTDFVHDDGIADTSKCIERSGIETGKLHSAVDDARRVIELIRIGGRRDVLVPSQAPR